MHLAYDLLDGYDALVLIDTIPSAETGDPPGTLRVLEVGPDDLGSGEFDAHGMNPVAVLANLEALGGSLPPTYVVGCVRDEPGRADGPDRPGRRRRRLTPSP